MARADKVLKKAIKHESGFGFFVKIDGQVKAGCLGYILGEHFYLSKIAHDVELNYYNVGNVELLKLIDYCISHKISQFHFLWGKKVDYKVRFGSVSYPLYDYCIYKTKTTEYYKDLLHIHIQEKERNIKAHLKNNKPIWKAITKLKYLFKK